MNRGTSRGCKALYLAIAIVTLFALLVWTPLPARYDHTRDVLVQQVTDTAKGNVHRPKPTVYAPATLATTDSKYVFATFLGSDVSHPSDPDLAHDNYFVATRILAYQLLHAPETRSNASTPIPFIVLVTAGVSEEKRERLRRDGAVVHEVVPVPKAEWIHTEFANWQDVFDKLRLWELTQFERIAFLDGDTVLTRPLDGVFGDPAVASQQTLVDKLPTDEDEVPQPSSYVFAGTPEMNHVHTYPPSEASHSYPNINYLNAGFFVLQPSLQLLSHYLSIMQVPQRFVPELPEQNLLNYAHRREGNMPWQMLDSRWNIHNPTVEDLRGGVVSLHEKWWKPVDEGLRPYLMSWRWRMEGFYEARDTILDGESAL